MSISPGLPTSSPRFDWRGSHPDKQCDVVMKGGITSGVVYPAAITEFATEYRLRGIGGASAGAIGAALAAAAEHGRHSERGGFELLDQIPAMLGGGGLGALFRAQPSTRALRRVMVDAAAAAGSPGGTAGKLGAVVRALASAFPVASVLALLPGILLIVVGFFSGWLAGILLVLAGILLIVLLWVIAMLARLSKKLTTDVPANLFGICTGLGGPSDPPALTEWLGSRIDELAGLGPSAGPLTFGDLWGPLAKAAHGASAVERDIDLRMISTCLSRSRPYEMPFEASGFFYEPAVWAKLFPPRVLEALDAASPGLPPASGAMSVAEWDYENRAAEARGLSRLPSAEDLPVIVATRMSLSFPLLISAVPLWQVDYDSLGASTGAAQASAAPARTASTSSAADPASAVSGLPFQRLLFTDGGLCSNFPVTLFDSALPSRPTFAINLGKLAADDARAPSFELARQNVRLPSPYVDIAASGISAVAGFASAALSTARDWSDNSYLDLPGYRDRIVRVMQSHSEGGLNLDMDAATITALSDRGQAAARALMDEFGTDTYLVGSAAPRTGWDNHRWVRYRALVGSMPDFLRGYAKGLAALQIPTASPPSFPLTETAGALATSVSSGLDAVAALTAAATPVDIASLTSEPVPRSRVARGPRQ